MEIKRMFLFVFFASILQLNAQESKTELFVNDNNEFVCFSNDTITSSIYSYGAFDEYYIGVGHYSKSKDIIEVDNTDITDYTATIEEELKNDSLIRFSFLYFDNLPIPFAKVNISNSSDNTSLFKLTDSNGIINMNSLECKKWINKNVLLHIHVIGFEASKKITLRSGRNYIVRSKIPNIPFIVRKKKSMMKIYKLDENTIKVCFSDDCNYTTLRRTIINCRSCISKFFLQ